MKRLCNLFREFSFSNDEEHLSHGADIPTNSGTA